MKLITAFFLAFMAVAIHDTRTQNQWLEDRVILRANLALEDVRDCRDEIIVLRFQLQSELDDLRQQLECEPISAISEPQNCECTKNCICGCQKGGVCDCKDFDVLAELVVKGFADPPVGDGVFSYAVADEKLNAAICRFGEKHGLWDPWQLEEMCGPCGEPDSYWIDIEFARARWQMIEEFPPLSDIEAMLPGEIECAQQLRLWINHCNELEHAVKQICGWQQIQLHRQLLHDRKIRDIWLRACYATSRSLIAFDRRQNLRELKDILGERYYFALR